MPKRLFPAFAALILLPALLLARAETPEAGARDPSFSEVSTRFNYRMLEDDHGGFYAVWTHELSGVWTLVAQHVNAAGLPLWTRPGALVVSDVHTPEDWDAFPDGKGGLVLIWVDGRHMRAQRFSSKGGAYWPSSLSVTTSTRPAVSPTGVADATGGAYFVWSEKRYADRSVLMSQRLNADGSTPWQQEGLRVSLRPSDQARPQVVYDGQSGYVVVWRDVRERASQLMAERLDFQGNRFWGQEGLVVTAPAGRADETPLAQPLGNGSAVVGWLGATHNVTRLFLQSIDAQGHFRWASQGINVSYGNWDQWNPVLLGNGQGRLWTGWEDYRNHSHWQVLVGNMDAEAHQTWAGGEVALGPAYGDQSHLALCEDGHGGIFAAWLDNRSGHVAVYAQNVDPNGFLKMGEHGKLISYSLVNPAPPQLVPLAPGRVAIFWVDRPKKDRWALYWTAVTGPAYSSNRPTAVLETPLTSGTTEGIEPIPAAEGVPTPQ